ncbi:MAG TPA: VapC toxin family PIN domain ribonuclease [Candidatus Omnitrophica bacterium]|nr:VapC toxin family PIN domain ribonuclease [Candidatus Omnitrophota bacterium]HCI45282.1 VapC toxin family PIN domain ribonuclease [Candidatus Omnitrophota bacterium]
MLVDTDVLIWYLRGNGKAKDVLDHPRHFAVSCVTYMEIVQGLRNKEELKLWKFFLKERGVQHIFVDERISSKAVYWMEEFFLSHNLRMADALIAATADSCGLDLLTGNYDDYKFLPGLALRSFKAR